MSRLTSDACLAHLLYYDGYTLKKNVSLSILVLSLFFSPKGELLSGSSPGGATIAIHKPPGRETIHHIKDGQEFIVRSVGRRLKDFRVSFYV